MNWEPVKTPFESFLPYCSLLISAVQLRLYLLFCLVQLVSPACIQLQSSHPAFIVYPFAFFLFHKIQSVTVTNFLWLCSMAEEYTGIKLLNESPSCASHTSAAGSPDFRGFIGTIVQILALEALHTGKRMLISSYTSSGVIAAKMSNNQTGHCKTEPLILKKRSFF